MRRSVAAALTYSPNRFRFGLGRSAAVRSPAAVAMAAARASANCGFNAKRGPETTPHGSIRPPPAGTVGKAARPGAAPQTSTWAVARRVDRRSRR